MIRPTRSEAYRHTICLLRTPIPGITVSGDHKLQHTPRPRRARVPAPVRRGVTCTNSRGHRAVQTTHVSSPSCAATSRASPRDRRRVAVRDTRRSRALRSPRDARTPPCCAGIGPGERERELHHHDDRDERDACPMKRVERRPHRLVRPRHRVVNVGESPAPCPATALTPATTSGIRPALAAAFVNQRRSATDREPPPQDREDQSSVRTFPSADVAGSGTRLSAIDPSERLHGHPGAELS